MKSRIFRALFASTMLVGIGTTMKPGTALAAAITFDYTGNSYSNGVVNGLGTSPLQNVAFYGTHLTGSVTFDDTTVTSSFTGTVHDVMAWNFSSGAILVSSAAYTAFDATFNFIGGKISDWDVQLSDASYKVETLSWPDGFFSDFALTLAGTGNTNNYYARLYHGGAPGAGIWTERVVPPISSAVPEPSTWAMMTLGFAGLGFMAYRRRRSIEFSAA